MLFEPPLNKVKIAERPPLALAISGEAVAYLLIVCVALLLRTAELDRVPLMPAEAHNALAAWRAVSPEAVGADLIPSSSLVFTAQSVGFSLLGGTEFAARIGTALASVALILLPILFRPFLGRTRALIVSILLALSPVLLIAGRASSPDVWALLFAGLSLWAFAQAQRTEQPAYTIAAAVSFGVLIFLTGVGGAGLALILIAAGALVWVWSRRGEPLDEPNPLTARLSAALRESPGLALAVAALVVLALGTDFMLYPAGLSAVGESIGGLVRAVLQPDGLRGYGTWIALFYEPALFALAIAGLIARRDRLTTTDQFLTVWVVAGVIASLIVRDGSPDHALWITVPLAVLAASAVVSMIAPDKEIAFLETPGWARWVIALCAFAVFFVAAVAFQDVGRALVAAPEALLSTAQIPPDSLILLVVSLMFLLIGYFLFASLWGSRVTWQGLGLGVLVFSLLTSVGGGWNASVSRAQDPAVFWHLNATHGDTSLLRETLFDVAERQSGGFPAMPVQVLAPDDGVLAWLLRDFTRVDYITNIADAAGQEVVLLPTSVEPPDLGGGYVGQDFLITRSWSTLGLNLIDLPGWWSQGGVRSGWISENRYVLWLRQDVYEGVAPG